MRLLSARLRLRIAADYTRPALAVLAGRPNASRKMAQAGRTMAHLGHFPGFPPVLEPNRSCGKLLEISGAWEMSMANGKRVVCIEDELEMIDLVKLILSRKGYQVVGALGGREGLEAIGRENPDLVLLDLMMPDMDGWEVYQKMKADDATKHIPVIVVTAKAQSIDKVLGLHIAKVDDYITKPFGPQELLESVETVLARQAQGQNA
jgi:two-component system response regulator VicR